jgi:hypothetical protein
MKPFTEAFPVGSWVKIVHAPASGQLGEVVSHSDDPYPETVRVRFAWKMPDGSPLPATLNYRPNELVRVPWEAHP